MVLFEELVFRGYALRVLRMRHGDAVAIVATAAAFGTYHLIGSQDWAMGLTFRFATSFAGGLLFAWVAIRTRGLAWPIGLHLGGNWVQASIAGFAPTDASGVGAVWRIAIDAEQFAALTAPDLAARWPYLAGLGLTALAVAVVTSPRSAATRH